jgi:aspartyl-tRNA(Asn)/glutamyl-tRNA(Gln) amidotransferase subunit A
MSKESKNQAGKYYTNIIPYGWNNSFNWELKYFAKDNFWTSGLPTTASSSFLTDFLPGQNATVIKLLNKKKFILFGKTVLDEFACGGIGLYANTGPIFNPHNSSHVVGGSSSGSAVAVVEGAVPFALGSDTGGSVRHPAAYCGVIGFKPSHCLVSRFGLLPLAASMDNVGILANSVSTAEKVFSVIAQPDVNDLLTIAQKNSKFKLSPSTKKLAILKGIEKYLPSSFAELYQKTLEILKKKGYQIEVVEIPRNIRENLQLCYMTICFSELVSHLNSLQGVTYGVKENAAISQKRSKHLGKVVQQRLLIGAYFLQNKEILSSVYSWRQKVKKWTSQLFRKYNFLIFPSTNSPAPKIDESTFVSLGSKTHWSDNLLLLANFAGLPSLSLPIGFSDGLPVSINLNSEIGNDKEVLKVAKLLEEEIGFRL